MVVAKYPKKKYCCCILKCLFEQKRNKVIQDKWASKHKEGCVILNTIIPLNKTFSGILENFWKINLVKLKGLDSKQIFTNFSRFIREKYIGKLIVLRIIFRPFLHKILSNRKDKSICNEFYLDKNIMIKLSIIIQLQMS